MYTVIVLFVNLNGFMKSQEIGYFQSLRESEEVAEKLKKDLSSRYVEVKTSCIRITHIGK